MLVYLQKALKVLTTSGWLRHRIRLQSILLGDEISVTASSLRLYDAELLDGECFICQDGEVDVVLWPCMHAVHEKCLTQETCLSCNSKCNHFLNIGIYYFILGAFTKRFRIVGRTCTFCGPPCETFNVTRVLF